MSTLGTVDQHSVRLERSLPASVERTWSYLVERPLLAKWLADGQVEPWSGGRVELRFDVDEAPERARAGALIRGTVSRCEPPRLLAYSWIDASTGSVAESAVPDSEVTFEMEEEQKEIRLRVTHARLPTEFVTRCGAGWHAHLNTLLARLLDREPEPFLTVFERALEPSLWEDFASRASQ